MTNPTRAQIMADMRFREFGNGATWVDFPMTQDSAQTAPTQAQIEAERAVGFREGVEWAKANLTAAAEAEKIDAFNNGYSQGRDNGKAEGIAATIERCMQAVWDAGGDCVEFHVAAIRAMKD